MCASAKPVIDRNMPADANSLKKAFWDVRRIGKIASLEDVTRGDVRICLWGSNTVERLLTFATPADLLGWTTEAQREKQLIPPFAPTQKAERTTVSLDCYYVS